MNRLEAVREAVDEIVLNIKDTQERRCAYLHLYGVSQFCSLLALKRGVDPELAAISGMLHDLYTYKTGISLYHSYNGAEFARPIVRRLNSLTQEEQKTICTAIYYHSDKACINGKYDEVLKDADVLQHYLYDTNSLIFPNDIKRLEHILPELGIEHGNLVVQPRDHDNNTFINVNKRQELADNAEKFAASNVAGDLDNKDFMELIKYWPENAAFDELKSAWCAAFVYHMCYISGIKLPIRHPNTSCRFAGVKAWYEWAELPENDFLIKQTEDFTPESGDILIYENIIPLENKEKNGEIRDHIGIVLSCKNGVIIVAEGNYSNRNYSRIVERELGKNIYGYIRIPNDYCFEGQTM